MQHLTSLKQSLQTFISKTTRFLQSREAVKLSFVITLFALVGGVTIGTEKFVNVFASESSIQLDEINLFGLPFEGPDYAPIVLVDFVDYNCGNCIAFHQSLSGAMQKYGEYIKHTTLQFPLSDSGSSYNAAKMVLTANEFGKYLEASNYIFEHGTTDDPIELANALNVDPTDFNTLYSSDEITARLDEMKAMGENLGISGTPMIILNEQNINGAIPQSELEYTILDELYRLGKISDHEYIQYSKNIK